MKNKFRYFIKSFLLTLFLLITPFIIFFAICTVFEQNNSGANIDAIGFFVEDYKLTVFDKTVSLDFLKELKYFGNVLSNIKFGIVTVFFDTLEIIVNAIKIF